MTDENQSLAASASDLHRRLYGQRPRRVKAYAESDYALILMQGLLTQVERTLAAEDSPERVAILRRRSQAAIEDALKAEVEELVGRKVKSFQSAVDTQANVGSFLFVYDA